MSLMGQTPPPLLDDLRMTTPMSIPVMKFTCEQIRSRKGSRAEAPYDFSPLVIDFKEIAGVIKSIGQREIELSADSRKTLIVYDDVHTRQSSKHWFAMEVHLDESLNIHILLLGAFLDEIEQFVVKIFKEKACDPAKLKLYKPDFILQHDSSHCSFFALYAAHRLRDIEQYTGGIHLFVYLQLHVAKTEMLPSGMKITMNRLPLRCNLSAQSRILWSGKVGSYNKIMTYMPDPGSTFDERSAPMNKKGEDAVTILGHHRVLVKEDEQNKCIWNFARKIEAHNMRFFRGPSGSDDAASDTSPGVSPDVSSTSPTTSQSSRPSISSMSIEPAELVSPTSKQLRPFQHAPVVPAPCCGLGCSIL